MDDLLIDNIVEEEVTLPSAASCSSVLQGHHPPKGKSSSKSDSDTKVARANNGNPKESDGNAADLCQETIVTMYTSDILSTEVNSFARRQTSTGLYYSGSSETESNVKCILSTILFLGVVAAIIVVAMFKNPGM